MTSPESTARKLYRITLSLTLRAPVMSQTSGAIGFGLDAAMRRDRQGRPAFPGSLLKGNLRHAWETLEKMAQTPSQASIDRWLGKPSSDRHEMPAPGTLTFPEYFSDLDWQPSEQSRRRYRIAIDETTGAVASGALQVVESPYPVGATPSFTGSLGVYCPPAELDELLTLLRKGFEFIPAIGALKTNGFGKIEAVSISHEERRHSQQKRLAPNLAYASSLGLRLKPLKPFCFAKPHIGAGNHFETEDYIPGGAIVAAIARRLQQHPGQWPMLESYLDHLTVTRALPVPEGGDKRPVALPLSLVRAGDCYADIASVVTDDSATDPLVNGEAPLFSIDWKDKDHAAANKILGQDWGAPEKQLEIRTSIDVATGAAKEGLLFSREEVDPVGFDWLANISLQQIPDEKKTSVITQLGHVLALPLELLGKSKASAAAELRLPFDYTLEQGSLESGEVAIYLQSAARLLRSGFRCSGTSQHQVLFDAYADAWKRLCDGLTLQRFYARQELLGGDHWWKRTDRHGQAYCPEIFTSVGSVFVFEIGDVDREKTLEILSRWRETGLPQLPDAPGGEHWKHNPWIANNGYGEIAVNLSMPTFS